MSTVVLRPVSFAWWTVLLIYYWLCLLQLEPSGMTAAVSIPNGISDNSTTTAADNNDDSDNSSKITSSNNNSNIDEQDHRHTTSQYSITCRLRAVKNSLHNHICELSKSRSLIEYRLIFPKNYTTNPLTYNITRAHKADRWARVGSSHGQTLLSLAFNYGILSLMTLKLGTEALEIHLEDVPVGCLGELNESAKIHLVEKFLLTDFNNMDDPASRSCDDNGKTEGEEIVSNPGIVRICHEKIETNGKFAKFVEYCCGHDKSTGHTTCADSRPNEWLTFLYVMLAAVRVAILGFGPLLFLSYVSGLTRDESPYTVKLRKTLDKTIVLCQPDTQLSSDIVASHVINLRNKRGFPRLHESVFNLPSGSSIIGKPFRVSISQYDILVNYKRLLTENRVPVGFWKSIARSIFFCKLRNVGPFQKCCKMNMFRHRMCSCIETAVPWISFWRKVGMALLIVLLPTPYYIRVLILYFFEYEEVMSRRDAAERLELRASYESSLVHYLLPNHPLFICIYIVYAITAVMLAYLTRRTEEGRFRRVIVGSFTDLKNLSWISVLQMVVTNVIWPFKRYGVLGIFVAFVYWPIVLPVTLVIYMIYCLPTIYLTIRMCFYSKRAFVQKITKRPGRRSYRIHKRLDETLQYFDADYLLGDGEEEEEERKLTSIVEDNGDVVKAIFTRQKSTRLSENELDEEVDNLNPARLDKFRTPSIASTIIQRTGFRLRNTVEHILAAGLCVTTLYAVLIILSECVGCFVEILVFTMMGIIVNASQLLKYIALIVMVVVYSYDCFNNVQKRYLKLNKALFAEVKGRIKDLDKTTSLPSYLQENHGFKSQELDEQAPYEMPDDITDKPPRHWLINDLVLFIDNEDMPRIPKKLFENVCDIQVAGVPGPVYIGLLYGVKEFMKIMIFVVFIFIVILSFGNAYQVSSTNQMLAALAGGSLPMILRSFMEPEKPDIEMGTVSFKSKLDEIIKNFAQLWPIYDFPFELYKPTVEETEKEVAKQAEDAEALNSAVPPRFSQVFDFPDGKGLLDAPPSDNNINLPQSSDDVARTALDVKTANNNEGVKPARGAGAKVCFLEEPSEPVTKVDLIIHLPERYDEIWLSQWSDLNGDGEFSKTKSDPGCSKEQPEGFALKHILTRTPSNDSVFVKAL